MPQWRPSYVSSRPAVQGHCGNDDPPDQQQTKYQPIRRRSTTYSARHEIFVCIVLQCERRDANPGQGQQVLAVFGLRIRLVFSRRAPGAKCRVKVTRSRIADGR